MPMLAGLKTLLDSTSHDRALQAMSVVCSQGEAEAKIVNDKFGDFKTDEGRRRAIELFAATSPTEIFAKLNLASVQAELLALEFLVLIGIRLHGGACQHHRFLLHFCSPLMGAWSTPAL